MTGGLWRWDFGVWRSGESQVGNLAPRLELWHGERVMPPRSRATPAPLEPAHVEQSQLAESVDRLFREIQAMRNELDEARAEIAWAMRNAIAVRPGELLDTTATQWPEPELRDSAGNAAPSIPPNDPRPKPPPGQLF